MIEEDAPRASGRRSKLEIACDILNVVSRGTEKPTRIMQLANVTWDDLIMYLEVLIRNHLLSSEVDGKRVTYSLTDGGFSLLDHYQKLKKEAAPLGLETMTKERISKALTYLPTIGTHGADRYAILEKRIRAEGAAILSARLVGKSGVVHSLGILAQRKDGSKHGYVILPTIDETQIMKLFVMQLDTEISVHGLSLDELSPSTGALAQAYSLDLQRWKEEEMIRPKAETNGIDILGFTGKTLLLEVDPAINYEVIVKEFANKFKAPTSFIFAFTWKGGPIYAALSTVGDVQIFSMTSQTTYPKPTGQGNELSVPQDDSSILLDLTAKTLQTHSDEKVLMIFDSVSDVVVSLGFEKAYGFLKGQKEILTRAPNITALFVMKNRAQDEMASSLIRGLYTDHLFYNASGLIITRAM